jgi:hypothetical protein
VDSPNARHETTDQKPRPEGGTVRFLLAYRAVTSVATGEKSSPFRYRRGAAYLYLTALEVPDVASQVHQALADGLDTPSGPYAQLVAAALIIRNLTRLPDPGGLAARLHEHADTLLT